ncbi:phage holin family protein [Sporosarcina saromensis]|uniref:Phage holin family protein n=1 Tax=Sporosarcina saromensis TaxID=359365 RepID=A0ABU4G5G3_9BACL|nr:phage holin family protein [Sporosarcina saromensis]MDW0112199.1 phage holin family protein [Sporosarcina saromensis]
MEMTGIKGIGALVISFIIYLIDVVNEAVVVLVFFMLLDVVTGLMRSWITKSWDSTIGFAGVVKKIGVFIMIGMAAAVEYMVMSVGQDPNSLIILGVTSFFIVNEGLSVLENCAQMGLPIPAVLFNALEKMHRDPSGKDHRLARHPMLDRIDKKELLKENEALHHQLAKREEKKDEN